MPIKVYKPTSAGRRNMSVSDFSDNPAKEVVIGEHVEVSAAAVAHGNLSVTVSNTTGVSQPV